jgi:hypothetical protein
MVYCATFVPPPVRRERGVVPHPVRLRVDIKTKSKTGKRKDRPDQNLNHTDITGIDDIS